MIAQAFPYAAVLKYNKILYSQKGKKNTKMIDGF